MMRAFLFILFLISQAFAFAGAVITQSAASGDLYIISIGIDDYSQTSIGQHFLACETDAQLITEKLSKDYLKLNPRSNEEHGLLKSYTLTNMQASYSMIKEVFKQVALQAKEEDNFVFFFAGFTFGNYLVPYYEGSESTQLNPLSIDSNSIDSNWISLEQMASWMEDISARNQLIISEAGSGKEFALNLISSLFEGNALIASTSERNRILVTTKNLGSEGYFCGSQKRVGALAHFISKSKSSMLAFTDKDAFEYELLKAEMDCGAFRTTYTAIYDESQYRKLLIRHQLQQLYRSVIAEDLEEDGTDSLNYEAKHYALIISTTDYSKGRPSWRDLNNPKRDADDMSKILAEKYGFEVSRIHNQNSNDVVAALIALKRKLKARDKVFIFIAGHGHYDEDFGTGFLVFKDGLSVQEDRGKYHSYLHLSTLRSIIDPFPSNHVFLVLDVCFGASFDINEKDLSLSNYQQAQRDLPLQEWMIHKDTSYTSRIFLASGTGEVPDYWSNSLHHSPFASKLLKALDEEEEFFSPGKLFLYTEGNITAPVLKRFGRHSTRGDFIIPVQSNP